MKEKLIEIVNLLQQKYNERCSFKKINEIDKQFDDDLRQLSIEQINKLGELANQKFRRVGDLLYRYDKFLKYNNMSMSAEKQKVLLNKMTVYAEIKSKCKQISLDFCKKDSENTVIQ